MFAKGLTPNWSKEVFTIKNVQNTLLCTYVTNDLNGEKSVGIFYLKKKKKINQKGIKIENVIN